ncbi:MAG TPA: carbon-nitrogen hydrolase family protein [Solirubrobacteraceae bacterium]|nr:carbon-nitrogen hydrolase family protein [Solirubrobacteraceae bacterium]
MSEPSGASVLRVAAIQLNSQERFDDNLEQADRLTRAAVADGAELVLLPEKWTVLGTAEQLRAGAQRLDGPAISWARGLAIELGIDLVAGSICELQSNGNERLANTAVHVSSDGAIAATYRKIHMFDVTVDGVAYHESEHEQPGDEVVISESAGGVELGLSICYDVRFPELYRILALRGARVMLVPAAFTLATTREHWEVLLRARAIENQAFVVAANQIGSHPPGRRSGGRSLIVDPWGVVLAQAGDAITYVTADLDLARLQQVRAELPSLANRQAQAYRWPVGE